MTATAAESRAATNGLRAAFGIGGAIALIVGILILVWPGRSLEAFALVATVIIAIYAIVGGLIYAGLGIFAKSMGGWSRVGHILLGVLFVLAGVIAFFNLGATAAWLVVFLSILVGVMWIVEGIVSLSTLSAGGRGWTIFFAIVSIIAGIALIVAPIFGAVVLWWFLGISLLVLGVLQIVRAFTLGRNA